jgi:hypothetical protein
MNEVEELLLSIEALEPVLDAHRLDIQIRVRKIVTRYLTRLQEHFPKRTVWYDDVQNTAGYQIGIDSHTDLPVNEIWATRLSSLVSILDNLTMDAGFIVLPALKPRMSDRRPVSIESVRPDRDCIVQRHDGVPIVQRIERVFKLKHPGLESRWTRVQINNEADQRRFDEMVKEQMEGII